MFNAAEFLANVKRAAVEAVRAEKPFALVRGHVTSIAPLKIQIDQKFELVSTQLLLTNAVRDYSVELVNEAGETKKYTVKLGLKQGERVLLLRTNGGQKFIVLDRLEALI